jgi:hypothetical protein
MMMHSTYTPVYAQDADTAQDGSAALEENLVGAPHNAELTAAGQTMMEVTAPATLPEGYEFQVVVGNLKFPVTVPLGGIEEGQKFSVPLPTHQTTTSAVSIPVGHWRDELTGLCNYGACHPHCWTACCCTMCKFASFFNPACESHEGGKADQNILAISP